MTIAQHFKGLSEPARLRMLNLLLQGELCGCDIQSVLGLSQSNVSRHLNYLKRVGLVMDRRDGFRVFYRIADPSGKSRTLLLAYLRHVFARESLFARDLRALRAAIRHGACAVSVRRSGRVTASAQRSEHAAAGGDRRLP